MKMAIFIICYDLKTPGKDYSSLTKLLESVTHCHAQGSVWFIEHAISASSIRDVLQKHVDANDVLFVGQVTNGWSGLHMPVCGKWLNDRDL
jgi:hypothetical protein